MTGQPCVKCGALLEANARFCGECGTQQPGAVVPKAAVRGVASTVFQGSGGVARPAPQGGGAPSPALDATLAAGSAAVRSPVAPPSAARPAVTPPPAAAVPARVEPPPPKDLIGQTLNNRYYVEQKLGEGGFGAVYRAKQTQMGRAVALKVLHARMARDQQVIGRFKREAQASSLLRNPHTVQVYDFDQTPEGIMYLAMEMLQGKSLHAILTSEGPLDPSRAAKVMDGICDSLGEAHQQGIVHRDIKPENIFLEPQPHPDFVKVLDFGIAKIVGGDGQSMGPALTAAGQTLGTLEYMSPEQLMGQQLDGRSDLYALGILAYEMLTGNLPFQVKTPGEMITAHLRTMPPPPSRMIPHVAVPPALDDLILRLLAKNRDERPRDTAAVRAELDRIIRGEPSGRPLAMAPATAPPPANPVVPVTAAPSMPPVVAPRAPQRQPQPATPAPAPRGAAPAKKGPPVGLIILIAGVVIAVAGVVAGLLLFSSK
jgi:serine/threonine-protein kinase